MLQYTEESVQSGYKVQESHRRQHRWENDRSILRRESPFVLHVSRLDGRATLQQLLPHP